ncbi:D-arabinono-1,4-lactone oxidase [Taxawa tesnikishii (nom. ined.)]|nr:D-arabinono-1,4-lactone oxidase [Dothideales sp. JES 119]
MDPEVFAEAHKFDPEVPFRASTTHIHHTWAKTFHSRPELYIEPHTLPEIQKLVRLARKCRRRIVVVGCGHSPSNLTCTSSWMVNLDNYNRILNVDTEKKRIVMESGIRLRDLNAQAKEYGLTMPNLGSIHDQAIAGAIATATHGSTLRHGLMSESVKSFRIVLSNGEVKRCSADENEELFRAGLVSLGALGILTEIEFEMTEATNIEWTQTLKPLKWVLDRWEGEESLWKDKEFVRVWWLPYMKRAVVWSASKTDKPERKPESSWYGGSVGFHTYHILLWLSNKVPRILPWIEWFVFGMQYGFSDDNVTSAVEPQRTGLLMNCLYSQFVNEWALPVEKGPEAITRLSKWLNREPGSGIPLTTRDSMCMRLWRPFLQDPPCVDRYYEAFEWLMKELGARPHWAKNFTYVSKSDIAGMYGDNLTQYLKVRDECDPEGVFVGAWHRKYIIPDSKEFYVCEEKEVARTHAAMGGENWFGEVVSRPRTADEKTRLLESIEGAEHDDLKDARTHGNPNEGWTGTRVFDKM